MIIKQSERNYGSILRGAQRAIFSVVVLVAAVGKAQSLAAQSVEVAPDGASGMERMFAGHMLSIHFMTHETSLPPRTANFPFDWTSICTGSRSPCVLLDNLNIKVDGKDVFIARSAYADCSDLHTAAVTMNKGTYKLIMSGGDGSESYMVILIFAKEKLLERDLIAGEDRSHVIERTTYDLMH